MDPQDCHNKNYMLHCYKIYYSSVVWEKLHRTILTISFHGATFQLSVWEKFDNFFFLRIIFFSHLHPFSNISNFSRRQFSLQFCQISSSHYFIQSRWRKLERHICLKSLVLHQHFLSRWHFRRLPLHGARMCSRQKET